MFSTALSLVPCGAAVIGAGRPVLASHTVEDIKSYHVYPLVPCNGDQPYAARNHDGHPVMCVYYGYDRTPYLPWSAHTSAFPMSGYSPLLVVLSSIFRTPYTFMKGEGHGRTL